ncbi:MAG: MatE transporter, partial [Nitrosomonas sp. PRO5]|nr:MatE transporter [Nitrosomonas sp. PRO5]
MVSSTLLAGSNDDFLPVLFAFIGGLLLNIMPCVLPVLSIKVLRLLKHQGEERGEVRTQGLLFGAGVLMSFAALAGLVIALKSLGNEIGWGFQFQEPHFVAIFTGLIFIFALSLFGIYEFSVVVPKNVADLSHRGGRWGSFWE